MNFQQEKIGQGLQYYVKTYGCQSNVRDTEEISGILEVLGFKLANDLLKADLVILNTCAVRENAEEKVFGEIGYLKQIKLKNPKFLFGICGCMIQEPEVVNKIINDIGHVDFAFGTHNIHMLPEILKQVVVSKQQIIHVLRDNDGIVEDLPTTRNSTIKAFVNIMYGCNNFCSYCIVPFTRGRTRSRNKLAILTEIRDLMKHGYKEITLLGQNVNDYGIDQPNTKYRFWNLLEDVAKTGIERIRFATSNPWNFDYKIVDIMKRYDNIMPYIHLPVQSGDETMLKSMKRQMKIEDYLKLIAYIRANIKDCAISTDLIVGFPNENQTQFANTIKLYNQIKYDNAYTFIYSKRKGTVAATLVDKISLATKEKRLAQLNELVRKCAKECCEYWNRKIVEVLVEGPSKTKKHILTGYSRQWKVVNFVGNAKVGDIVKVKVTSASRFSLNGEQI